MMETCLPIEQSDAAPLIPQFFAGRDVFITGATGFMGKVLVERLLSTCPHIGQLHLLMRQKKGVAPETRLQQLKHSQVLRGKIHNADILRQVGLYVPDRYVWRRRRPQLLVVGRGRTNLLSEAPLTRALRTLNLMAQNIDIFTCALSEFTALDTVRARCPNQLDKLRLVEGDTAHPGLALPAHAQHQLREVSVVFHCAATLRFDEPLSAAVSQNVASVIALMELCDQLPHLEAFVHVSTAYANTDQPVLEERVYPPPVPLDELLALASSVPASLLAEITPKYIAPRPNTYTFTKAMAESAIEERASSSDRYRTAIFRPSIVIAALRDPYPGWIEGLNGPSGVMVGAGKGLLHVLRGKGTVRADMIPVDIAIDTMIAVAWHIATSRPTEVLVYNCCSAEKPITWQQFNLLSQQVLQRQPLDNALWFPCITFLQNKILHKIAQTLLQTLPLHTLAHITKLSGLKPKMDLVTVCERLQTMNGVLKFFTLHEWHFQTDNFRALRESLSPADACIYNLDPHTIELRVLHNAFLCTLAYCTLRTLRVLLPEFIRVGLKMVLSRSGSQG